MNYNAKFDQMVGSKQTASTRLWARETSERLNMEMVVWWTMITAGLVLIAMAFLT
jgi:hypothetical protein